MGKTPRWWWFGFKELGLLFSPSLTVVVRRWIGGQATEKNQEALR
jgi:hypothetical protein